MAPGKSQRVNPVDRAQLAESPVKLSRVTALFSPYRWELALVVVIIVATSVVSLGQPFMIKAVIDDALPNGNTTLLVWCVIGMIAVAVFTGVFAVWQTWLATSMGQSVMHTLRTQVFAHLRAQSIAFFKRTRGGEIQSRLTNDITGMQSVITNTASSVASNLTTVIAISCAMVWLNWQLSLVTLLILPPAILMTRRVALVRRDITAKRQRALANLLSQVEESLSVSGAQLTKTLGSGGARQRAFDEQSRALIDLELRSKMAGKWRMATMNMAFAAVPAVIYLAAGFPPVSESITAGTLIAFTTLQVSLFRPLMGLLNITAEGIASLALLSRIFEYLDLPIEVLPPANPVPLPRADVRGEVRFENVAFRYPDGDVDVLTGIDLTIPPGGSIAVVGETGSGKSTLASLMFRLADPTSGRITVDGVDLRDLDPDDLVNAIGMVSQDTYLVHASIRENLLQAKPEASDEELWTVLVAAQIADTVAALPDRLDTIVGARGHRLSGGERQRIAVARTLLRNPKILILDEATSALDTDTEYELQAALELLMQGRTSLTIAHRLSTVRNADQICVLDGGRVIEQGTHEELVAAQGRYAHLVGELSQESNGVGLPLRLAQTPLGAPLYLSSSAHDPARLAEGSDVSPEGLELTEVPEPAEPAGTPGRWRRTRRTPLAVLVSLVAVAMVTFAFGTEAPQTARGVQPKASDTVAAYLQALAKGDADTAVSYLDEAPADATFLSDPVLKDSNARAPISGIAVPEVVGDGEAQVAATYLLGTKPVTAQYHVVRNGSSWSIKDGLTELKVPKVRGTSLKAIVNGRPVTRATITVFPGSYRATVDNRYLALADGNTVLVTAPDQTSGRFTLNPTLTSSGKEAALTAARKALNECLAATVSEPAGCPNTIRWASPRARQAASVRWTLLNDPWLETPTLVSDAKQPGLVSATVPVLAHVYASTTTQWGRTYTWQRKLPLVEPTFTVDLTDRHPVATWSDSTS